jgi:hypothetical protein
LKSERQKKTANWGGLKSISLEENRGDRQHYGGAPDIRPIFILDR